MHLAKLSLTKESSQGDRNSTERNKEGWENDDNNSNGEREFIFGPGILKKDRKPSHAALKKQFSGLH